MEDKEKVGLSDFVKLYLLNLQLVPVHRWEI
jgi:hypothetical protein